MAVSCLPPTYIIPATDPNQAQVRWKAKTTRFWARHPKSAPRQRLKYLFEELRLSLDHDRGYGTPGKSLFDRVISRPDRTQILSELKHPVNWWVMSSEPLKGTNYREWMMSWENKRHGIRRRMPEPGATIAKPG